MKYTHEGEEEEEVEISKTVLCKTIHVADQSDLDFNIQATQNRDKNILKLREQLERENVDGYELKDGLVFRVSRDNILQLYVPLEMEDNVIRLIHEKICHLGIDKTYKEIRRNYWFKNMKGKVETFIKNCLHCVMCSPPVRINEHNLFNIPKKALPFDTIHVDHFGPLPSIQSVRKHLFVVIDAFTKFCKTFPCEIYQYERSNCMS